jgi:outer membrane lipase/esterase
MSKKLSAKLGLVAAATILTASFTSTASAAFNFSQMISFGDSLSDTGNVYLATGCHVGAPTCAAGAVDVAPSQSYWNGRFQDGPAWNEAMASQLGIAAPTPSLAQGTNFAFGGARTAVDGSVPSVQTQVNQYLGATGGVADPNAIFTLFAGGNDIKGVAAGDFGPLEAFQASAVIPSMVNQLIAAGAKSILVANVPNVGLAPIIALGGSDPAQATGLTAGFNAGFEAVGGLPEVVLVDTFTTSNLIAADIANGGPVYGFTNANDSCAMHNEYGVNPDPSGSCDSYLFYDLLHPTAAANAVIAGAALGAAEQLRANRAAELGVAPVPVPAAAWLFVSGLAGLAGLRKARK